MSVLPTAIPLEYPKEVIRSKPMVTEAEYWEKYYGESDVIYEWNNGLLEEKPVSDHLNYLMYSWFVEILRQFLSVHPIAEMTGLEMGFRLALSSTIRKPDLGVVRHDNPVALELDDRTYHGIYDMCIEALSDSSEEDVERDTVTKKEEYATSAVKEYYILHNSEKMAFYRLNARGVYMPIKPTAQGVIKSKVLPGFQFRIDDLYQKPSLKELAEDKVYQGFILPFYREEKKGREKAEAKIKRLEAELARIRNK
jgi:Uma2 family endonuclease